jgi:hypothetical protein
VVLVLLLLQGTISVEITREEKELTVQQFLEKRSEELKQISNVKSLWGLSDMNGRVLDGTTSVADLLASAEKAYLCQDEDDLPHAGNQPFSFVLATLLCSFVTAMGCFRAMFGRDWEVWQGLQFKHDGL